VVGVIQMLNRIGQDHFTASDLGLLEKLLDQSSLAIERSDVFQKMADLATTDDLTHLYNLRYLLKNISRSDTDLPNHCKMKILST
jgi:GAF domain-containing protein